MSTEASQNDIMSTARSRLATILQSAWTQISTTINNNLPPETREQITQNVVIFARSRPILATLLLSQLAFSGIPLLLFILLTAGIFIFSLVATLILGILGALMVTLFCMGLGSLILIPTLFVTTLTAGGIWLWGWGLYYAVQWVGSGDTALLTRLSLLLIPQRPANYDGYGHGQDEKKDLDGKVSTESNGHVEKQVNGLN
ncbi:hypothetical protein EIK77_002415 [Talaromyces pinophilus]|nr:hypothetical protein EIK77_002415 [Talaromyces pinophilus]PCG96427.1 Hypothetical protein PENO1_068470 [Penicillium occitanis (nom. inval.)]PCG96693.1 hypothetical protein PENOC_071570 [Penicillium occitanis (nom. inval.)]